jgi:hypothetical protein
MGSLAATSIWTTNEHVTRCERDRKVTLNFARLPVFFPVSFSHLVGGFKHFLFSIIYGIIIIPTDELIFLRGVGQPPTSTWRLQGFGHKVMLVEASFAG